jgi:long-chain acyl-CoA synthetase
MHLNNLLERAAMESPDAVAVRHAGGQITYTRLHEAVRRMARGLQRIGVERGDRIALILPNLPQFVIAYYALLRIGAVVIPVNYRLPVSELALLLEDCEAAGLIFWSGFDAEAERLIALLPLLCHKLVLGESVTKAVSITRLMAQSSPTHEMAPLDEDDAAVVWYGSAITGRPKGAEYSHNALARNALAARDILKVTQEDELLGTSPLYTPVGQSLVLNLAVSSSAAVNLSSRDDLACQLREVVSGNPTIVVGNAGFYRSASVIDDIQGSSRLRLAVSFGSPLDDIVIREFERRFSGYILECYAMRETGPVCSFNQWRNGRRVGSLGHPIPGMEIRVLSPDGRECSLGELGELAVRGSCMMRGYLGRPRLTASRFLDRWFMTGDLGKMDINGFFYHCGRVGSRTVVDGDSISLERAEEVLLELPGIQEVIVGQTADPEYPRLKACVILKEHSNLSSDFILEYCANRLPLGNSPEIIRFYKDFPTESAGGIDYQQMFEH